MKRLSLLFAALLSVCAATSASAKFTGVLYASNFLSHKIDSVNVVNGIMIGGLGNITTLDGADGLVCRNATLELFVGGQLSNNVYRVNPTTGAHSPLNVPAGAATGGAFLTAFNNDESAVYTTGLTTDGLAIIDYATGATTVHNITGTANGTVSGIGFDPAGVLYVTDSPNTGLGSLYTVNQTTFAATLVMGPLAGGHGITYDAYTGHLFIVGGDIIQEIDPSIPSVVRSWDVGAMVGHPDPQAHLDQGWSDGKGNFFAASNAGPLIYMDLTDAIPVPVLSGDLGPGADDVTGCAAATPPICEGITPGSPSFCTGGSVELCGQDTPGLTYLWNTNETTRCITANTAGHYRLIITNEAGLSDTCETDVTETNSPCSITPESATLCVQDTATAKTEFCGPGGEGVTWSWTGPGNFTATTRCIAVNLPGTYTLVTHRGNCRNECTAVLSLTNCGGGCWMTGGGCLNGGAKNGQKNSQFGGNVGPPPSGSWEHHERKGNETLWNFHSHDAHADSCWYDKLAGPCSPKGPNNNINWSGTGTYSVGNGAKLFNGYFKAHVEDHGEPGNSGHAHGCGTTDYYTITVWNADTKAVVFTASGYIDCGNLQLHKLNGKFGEGVKKGEDDGSTFSEVTGFSVKKLGTNPARLSDGGVNFRISSGTLSIVRLNIYDASGRLVATPVRDRAVVGESNSSWDGTTLHGARAAAGTYFYRATSGADVVSGRFILID